MITPKHLLLGALAATTMFVGTLANAESLVTSNETDLYSSITILINGTSPFCTAFKGITGPAPSKQKIPTDWSIVKSMCKMSPFGQAKSCKAVIHAALTQTDAENCKGFTVGTIILKDDGSITDVNGSTQIINPYTDKNGVNHKLIANLSPYTLDMPKDQHTTNNNS